jgi:hypothetical protein
MRCPRAASCASASRTRVEEESRCRLTTQSHWHRRGFAGRFCWSVKWCGPRSARATLTNNDFRSGISRFQRIQANLGNFPTETPASEAPKHFARPLFPRNPLFPALRSGPMAGSGASRRKQIPSSTLAVEPRPLPDLYVPQIDATPTDVEEGQLLQVIVRVGNRGEGASPSDKSPGLPLAGK